MKKHTPEEIEDYRLLVGAQRREKTRIKLLETALTVFNTKGPDLAVTEDFIVAAGISRGTFYNHFKTASDLLLALSSDMSDEVLQVIDPIVLTLDNPVHRFSAGVRLYMQMAYRYPLWGDFLRRVGTRIATRGQLIETYLTRDLRSSLDQHLINVDNVLIARDIVLGSIFYGIETMLIENMPNDYPEKVMFHVLVGLGVKKSEAKKIAFMELPLPNKVEGHIFSRLQQRRKR
jgi:AcrR family transcriptional regulator